MRKLLPILLALLAFSGTADEKLAGPRSATVMWLVETARPSLGLDPAKLQKSAPALRSERVTFTGLEPGKTYHYNINGSESGIGSFKTAPLAPAPATATTAATFAVPFQFVVYGDTRTRHDVHRSIVAAVLKNAQPDFIVHTGDTVADGGDPSLWPIFFDVERELLRKTAFFPSLGNHERNAPEWHEYFHAISPYYSFNWGNAHFSVLDTDITNTAPGTDTRQRLWDEQVKWLREDLERNQRADFRFVVGHHPPMTAVSNRQGDNLHMAALMPMLQQYKVAAGFFGHDHNYQHFLKAGIHYFVTGGGGAPLYDVDKPPADITRKVARSENFLVVKVDGKTAHIEALRPDGELLDVVDLKP
jgi:hypothetical protein